MYATYVTTPTVNFDVHQSQPESETDKQRWHLHARADSIRWKAQRELRYQFGITSRSPEDAEEFVEWIKEGKYEILDKDEDPEYYDYVYGIRFNPVPKDGPGFRAAEEALNKDLTALKDTITIASPADALVALQAFETKYATKH